VGSGMTRVLLVRRNDRPSTAAFTDRLKAGLAAAGAEIAHNAADADLVVTLGGDGTMLAGVREARKFGIPTLGFNLGTIGFLTEAEPDALDQVTAAIAEQSYRVEERMTVEACLDDDSCWSGVNDVVVEKIESQRLVVLEVTIDGEPFISYRADGLVVATPTGSTAYNFSAGGPLIDPAVPALVVTPVAAHSLFSRSLVLAPTAVIQCRVAADRSVRVSIDGLEAGAAHLGSSIEIRRGDTPALFATLDSSTFAARVKRKFGLV